MALSNSSALSAKTILQNNSLSLLPSSSSSLYQKKTHFRSLHPISAVHAAEPTNNNSVVAEKLPKLTPSVAAGAGRWSIESWKLKKALQLPDYPNEEELEAVLKTIESFPPIVFAGEARSLEERLAEAAMGNAFLLQGGDCAESFKEFSANNIRDTFRILLQMGVVLMFGGQMPVIKVRLMLFMFLNSVLFMELEVLQTALWVF